MLPDIEVTVYDNGGETIDRYTVCLHGVPGGDYALCIGADPRGYFQHEYTYEEGPHLGDLISLDEMTNRSRRAVMSYLSEITG